MQPSRQWPEIVGGRKAAVNGGNCLSEVSSAVLSLESMESCLSLFGANDRNVPLLENELKVRLAMRGSDLTVSGPDDNVSMAVQVVEKLKSLAQRHAQLDRTTLRYAVALVKEGDLDRLDDIAFEVVAITHRGRPIRCKTLGQYQYVKSIREHELTFAVGPAGTGKTYLAMALAVVALRNKEVERIVLTRPAVEAGEKLGFLPGDLNQKVDPYLRPLYDALYDMMGAESYQRLQERGVLEVAPLAYMRGRTLSDSFIILDEAQNTTPEQMKMFLTRFGSGSRVVVTGDDTQTDLASWQAIRTIAGSSSACRYPGDCRCSHDAFRCGSSRSGANGGKGLRSV